MIPKIIHYIWLGKNPLPKLVEKCIESWKKFLPEYEIKRWDESNLDLDVYKFARDAYDAKKYAFASDVLRYDILQKEGGIFLDVDVEILKPIDKFLKLKAFVGFEQPGIVNPGLVLAAEKNCSFIQDVLDIYKKLEFKMDTVEKIRITSPLILTDYLKRNGLKGENEKQVVNDITVFPREYFCPIDYETGETNITENTYAVHHYLGSWLPPKKGWAKFKNGIKKCVKRIFGKK